MLSEKLSAFIDGELDESEEEAMLSEMRNDAGVRSTWERMCLAGAALRDEEPLNAPSGFVAGVMDQLEQEGAEPVAPHSKVVSLRTRRTRSLVGMAVAASMAAAVVVVVYMPSTQQGNQPGMTAASSTSSPHPRTVSDTAGTRASSTSGTAMRTASKGTANRAGSEESGARRATGHSFQASGVLQIGNGNMEILAPGVALEHDMQRATHINWARLIQPFSRGGSSRWKMEKPDSQLQQFAGYLQPARPKHEQHVADGFGFMARPVHQDVGLNASH